MNKTQKARQKHFSKQLIDETDRVHVNCIRISTNNSKSHEQEKFNLCYYLKKIGSDFITEARFKGSKNRCDIIDLTRKRIYEIVCSESEQSIQLKREKYPKEFELKVVKVGI